MAGVANLLEDVGRLVYKNMGKDEKYLGKTISSAMDSLGGDRAGAKLLRRLEGGSISAGDLDLDAIAGEATSYLENDKKMSVSAAINKAIKNGTQNQSQALDDTLRERARLNAKGKWAKFAEDDLAAEKSNSLHMGADGSISKTTRDEWIDQGGTPGTSSNRARAQAQSEAEKMGNIKNSGSGGSAGTSNAQQEALDLERIKGSAPKGGKAGYAYKKDVGKLDSIINSTNDKELQKHLGGFGFKEEDISKYVAGDNNTRQEMLKDQMKSRSNRELTFAENMGYYKVPQKAAGVGATAWLVSSMSSTKGHQSNAELYGQQTPYR